MKPLHIDFASANAQRASPLAWLALAAGVLLCIAAGLKAAGLAEQARSAALEPPTLTQQDRHPTAAPAPAGLSAVQAAAVNGAIRQLDLPWHELLDAVETATPASIGLLALEPDARRQTLKGLAEARDSDTMLAYLAALREQKLFRSLLLGKHETNSQDPNRPLRFQFEARWGEEATPPADDSAQPAPATTTSAENPPRGFPQEGPVTGLPSGHKQ